MSNFAFLQAEWPAVHEAAVKAEAAVYADPRTACFYARRTLELAVAWAYKSDESLHLPYQTNLSALLHDPTFKKAAGEAVFLKTQVITRHGNQAVHSHRAIQESDALTAVRELFHVGYWLACLGAGGGAAGGAFGGKGGGAGGLRGAREGTSRSGIRSAAERAERPRCARCGTNMPRPEKRA